MNKVSETTGFKTAVVVNLYLNDLEIEDIAPCSFYACLYENEWYLGIANFVLIEIKIWTLKFCSRKALQFSSFGPVGIKFDGSQ